jgi:hypothetical protein
MPWKPTMSADERFWSLVQRDAECWIWLGFKNRTGYGRLRVGSRTDGSRTLVMAHRFAWELTYGAIPDNLRVLHRCDNPPCVRPDHLFIGTQVENVADCREKGRLTGNRRRGETNHKAILTADLVREIRRLASDTGRSSRALARQFGVCRSTITKILSGQYWRHVQ